MMVTQITSENYKNLVNGDTPIIIDHFAEWCGPCRMLSPIFEKVSSAYTKKLIFGKVDIEVYPEIASQNSVFSIPCIILFYKGREIDRIIGYMNENKLKKIIDKLLEKI